MENVTRGILHLPFQSSRLQCFKSRAPLSPSSRYIFEKACPRTQNLKRYANLKVHQLQIPRACRTRVGHSFIMNDAVHSRHPITGSGVQLTSIPPCHACQCLCREEGIRFKNAGTSIYCGKRPILPRRPPIACPNVNITCRSVLQRFWCAKSFCMVRYWPIVFTREAS